MHPLSRGRHSSAYPASRSPCNMACVLTRVHWLPSVRRPTMTSVPASTPCRWAHGLGEAGWGEDDHGLLGLFPVSVWEGPAGAECEGCADHPCRPEGPAQGAVLCVARGLPVTQSSKVGSQGGVSGPALVWMSLLPRALRHHLTPPGLQDSYLASLCPLGRDLTWVGGPVTAPRG